MIGINLLPWREQKREEQKRQFVTIIASSMVLAVFFIALIHFWINIQIQEQVEVNTYFKKETAVLDGKIQQIKNLQEMKKSLIARMNLILALQQERPEIINLFEGIVNITPKGIYLTEVTRNNHSVKVLGYAQANSEISMMLKNIDAFKWFDKAVLNEIKNDSHDSIYSKKFELQFNERRKAI